MDDSLAEAYDAFLRRSDQTLFFYCGTYRRLLKAFLGQEDHYLLCIDDHGEILGALPAFLCRNERYGPVLNSLPFYGSNGGVIELDGNHDVRRELLRAFTELAQTHRCATATIITSPFEQDVQLYQNHFTHDLRDHRIGQVTCLDGVDGADGLMQLIHSKTRNMVRKATRSGVSVAVDNSEQAMRFLATTHTQNMARIGGRAKPAMFFECVQRVCHPEHDYRIYVASVDGQPVAALLVLCFNRVAEYFTPVVVEQHRERQPMSLIIFEAMLDAVRRGCRYWNWGGTWLSQQGVHQFKKRWGTQDRPYHYFTWVRDRAVLELPREAVVEQWPYAFVYPFDVTMAERARQHSKGAAAD